MTGAASLAFMLIDRLGAVGIAVGVLLNGLGVPGLSEVLLPLGGVAVRQGRISLIPLFVLAMVGQVIGVSIAYLIARSGGLPLIERYGKYIFISKRELDSARRAFDRYGGRMILIGSFTPGIQGFVGYAAGVSEMNYGWFLVSAVAGKFVWVSALLYLGWVLGHHLGFASRVIQDVGLVILVAFIALIIWHIRRNMSPRSAEPSNTRKEP
jgi:membrane protein DedA with SNARE-associated domain